jgi:hypothetical protein
VGKGKPETDKLFSHNTYAQAVDNSSKFIRRTQSLNKINNFGMGVIYYWHWAWSYSTIAKDPAIEKQDPDKFNYGIEGEKVGKNDARYSGRFSYLGLSIQLPTMRRIKEHIKSAYTNKSMEYLALGQALYADNEDGRINDGTKIPKIMHICSFFDLAALEIFYISKFGLQQGSKSNKPTNFHELISKLNSSNYSKIGDGKTIGLNTEAGGQGGPLAGNTNRSPMEWILAAYYHLVETDSHIIDARKEVSELPSLVPYAKAKAEAGNNTLDEKIYYIIEGALNKNLTRGITTQTLKSITINDVSRITLAFGLRDNITMKSRSADATDFKTNGVEDGNFDTVDYLPDDSLLKKLEIGLSFDVETAPKLIKSYLTGKEGIRAEFRDVIAKIMVDSFPTSGTLKQKITFTMRVEENLKNFIPLLGNYFESQFEIGRIEKQLRESGAKIPSVAKRARTRVNKITLQLATGMGYKTLQEYIEEKSPGLGKKLIGLKVNEKKIEDDLNKAIQKTYEELHAIEREIAAAIIESNTKVKQEARKAKVKGNKLKNSSNKP